MKKIIEALEVLVLTHKADYGTDYRWVLHAIKQLERQMKGWVSDENQA